jgi:hypothetical protein
MFRRALLASAIVLVIFADAALASHRAPCSVNGCGPTGWRIKLVLDRFLTCEFRKACDEHDLCYGRCMACGPRHDDNMCRTTDGRTSIRSQCDLQLKTSIEEANNHSPLCDAFAWLFWWGCDRFGERYFGLTGAIQALKALARTAEEALAGVRADLEAIANYASAAGEQETAARLEALKEPLIALSRADRALENRFVYKLEDGQPKLSVEAKTPPPQPPAVQSPEGRTFRQRQYLNEIDITNMRVGGRPVDLDQVIRRTPGISPEKLNRTFRYEPAK